MRWLRKLSERDPFAVTMSGVKLADRVLILGCSDARLIAALAIKSGLTGRACAVDASADRAAEAGRIAEREGALVETTAAPYWTLPFDADAFDLVVLRDILASMSREDRGATIREAGRVLRPGGRCMVIETSAPRGIRAFFRRREVNTDYAGSGGAPHALRAEGFAGVRTLADREGLVFIEGVKKNI
jgi:ubiquinone/menaquinone biosynthesis C-methylase UbiE